MAQGLRRVFSPRVEDSLRLRALGLAALWLAALALLWVGGSHWVVLGGGVVGAIGHGVSWHRRRHRSRLWPLLIAGLVIVISFAMRSQMLEALSGNWLPLGQFLVLVQALASFDLRTRGGLYASLALAGIILFFASQQAFDLVFGVFLIAFVALLLAFLALAFLEDGVRQAQVHWRHRSPNIAVYWVGTACAVFALSGLAFWIMPRGDGNPIGVPQVAVLPFSQETLGSSAPLPEIDPRTIPSPVVPEELPQTDAQVAPPNPAEGPDGGPEVAPAREIPPPPAATVGSGGIAGISPAGGGGSDVVFFVRTKVASYWKGWDLDTFDGQRWLTDIPIANFNPRQASPNVRYNRESFGLDNRVRYGQTFFIQQDQPGALFSGYRGLRIIADEGSLEGYGVQEGDSYRVLSAYPRFTAERLRQDRAGQVSRRYLALPEGSERLRELARRITQGAASDFNAAERIIGFLGRQTTFDPHRPFDLTSSAPLEEFLFEDRPGSALDYATATVMLARASGLPSRLAVGYLPGARDPFSGSYMVRERDAHAWAEVFFEGHGWVPLDTAPRGDIAVAGSAAGRVGYLFQGQVGERAYQAVKSAPSRLADLVSWLLGHQGIWLAAAPVGLAFLALRWWYTRSDSKADREGPSHRLAYTPIPGQARRDLLKMYRQAQQLLRRQGMEERRPWQTAGQYAQAASQMPEKGGGGNAVVREHLDWFTQAVWQAAYNPARLPTYLPEEARRRLAWLKKALRGK